ncbi:DUF3140 domain-containing protein [Rubripirellula amarantea]|nr:DUF3140 domain-containing protein [Rubripirellula amarantea]
MALTLNDEDEETYQVFYDLVNMEPKEIEEWLQTEQSQSVGQTKDGDDESVGHKSGSKIVDIKRTKKSDLTDDQFAHIRKVCGYIKRHTAQRPEGNIEETDWCYSLKNWGHDPTR